MRLDEAYRLLNLRPVLEHETEVMRRLIPQASRITGIGTTTRMLIELYLDLVEASDRVGYGNLHRLRFVVVCRNLSDVALLRTRLKDIHGVLKMGVDVACVSFFPHDGSADWFRQVSYCTWGVFCDHAVKEAAGNERIFGPQALVRSVLQVRKPGRFKCHYEARDRDGELVCNLTPSGMDDLVNHSTCPVHFCNPTVATNQKVTFAAWSRRGLEAHVHMREAFNL